MISIFAMPADRRSLQGHDLEVSRANKAQQCAQNGYKYIPAYDSIADLFAQITAILKAANDRLGRLEICAHGLEDICDSLTGTSAQGFATRFAGLALADAADIFLNGCLTGLTRNGSPSIAEQVANALPRAPSKISYRITVRGTRGYSAQGTSNMQRNLRCLAEATWRRHHYPMRSGSTNAVGNSAWNIFRNWTP